MFIETRIFLLLFFMLSSVSMIGCSDIIKSNNEPIDPRSSLSPAYHLAISPTPIISMVRASIITSSTIILTPTYTSFAISTPMATETPWATNTPSETNTSIPTDTPIPTETASSVWNPAGNIIAPILLYHHVSDDDSDNRYFVTMDDFREQMESLYDWRYTSITASYLAGVIRNGGEIPNRPVVITFDDGYIDVYENAFPIMQEMGFIGVIYIYVDHVGSKGFVNIEHIQELADNGWEVGNHSMSHSDLTLNHSNVDFEVQQSRITLEGMTGVKADTFAYPYGKTDDFVIGHVRDSGYLAGMGLGLNCDHAMDTLFNLNRIEVYGEYDLSKFIGLLPWSDK